MTSPAGTTATKKRLARKDVAKQVRLLFRPVCIAVVHSVSFV